MIAALFVQTGGCYFGLEDVDPWDEARDARLYDGPHPVVAHPPCARWCMLAGLNQHRYGIPVGSDGGLFEAALAKVETYGGVLEHPASSLAWDTYKLQRPFSGRWTRFKRGSVTGWTCQVSQIAYGHRARKRTWLYYVGANPPPDMDWHEEPGIHGIGGPGYSSKTKFYKLAAVENMSKKERLATPPRFRDALIALAAGVK